MAIFDEKILAKVKTAKAVSHGDKKRVLVTAALPYINNIPHLGNLVGSHLPADIFARFCRLKGWETVFIGGADEHGTPTEVAAQKEGLTPAQLCDKYYALHRKYYEWFGISYDNFSRTSGKIHHDTTREFFKRIYENDYITEGTLKLPYCNTCKRFLPDRFVEGACPHCGFEPARGDQCDKCTRLLDPAELLNPRCIICKSKPEIRESRHLFLNLEKLSPKLKEWIENNTHWKTNVRNAALGWIHEGLKQRCITRDLKWGVKVPLKGYEDKVFYVWFDAPIGYVSFTREWAGDEKWKKWWLEKDTEIVHFIGKDNIPFHTIFWPAILIAEGTHTLPWQVAGLEYLNYEGRKFSKSRNVGVFLDEAVSLGFEPDVWRYYLVSLLPETSDSNFSWSDFEARVNNELVANLGNFVNRVLTFIENNFGGAIPKPGKLGQKDEELLKKSNDTANAAGELIYGLRFRDALKEIFALSAAGNKYFQDSKPWETVNSDKKACATTLYVCAQVIERLGALVAPFLPFTSAKIAEQLGIKNATAWKTGSAIKAGHRIGKPSVLFHKVEREKIAALEKKFGGEKMNTTDTISVEDVRKVDMRVGEIISAEKIPKSEKLLKLIISLGAEKRQCIAGIAQHYRPEQLVGKKVTVVANLKPAKIMGMESQCMLLVADGGALLAPDRDVGAGTVIS